MIAGRGVTSDRLGCAVTEEQTSIVAVERVAEGRLDADAGGRTDEDESVDACSSQQISEGRLIEAAVAVLRDDQLALFWTEVGDDLGVPRAGREDPARLSIGGVDGVADALKCSICCTSYNSYLLSSRTFSALASLFSTSASVSG